MTAPSANLAIAGTAGTQWDWVLLLPPGWVGLPTAATEGRRAVAALLDRRLRQLPRDTIASGRRMMERELRAHLAEARVAGASDVYTQVDLVQGMPVSAGLTVSKLRMDADDGTLLEGLTVVLGRAEGVVESGVATAGELPALRRRRHFLRPLADGMEPQPQTAVDWIVSLPDSEEVLVLAFATSTEQVADALVTLFDAIACSLEITPRR